MLVSRFGVVMILALVGAVVAFACSESATLIPDPTGTAGALPTRELTYYTSDSSDTASIPASTAIMEMPTAMSMPMATVMPTPAAPPPTPTPQPAYGTTRSLTAGATIHFQAQSLIGGLPILQLSGGNPPLTTFQDYQRSLAVATVEDAISTFSLDTDRTSFQLALSWAREGYPVEPDSVRAEEWVNAFNYDYDAPSDGEGFAIATNLVQHPIDEDKHLARISFQAPVVHADERPLNVTLVLDASGSMAEGNRVEIARTAAEAIRQSLGDTDRIAVVQFSTDVLHRLTVEHRSPGDEAVQRSISLLQPNNNTNVQAGLNLGVKLADQIRDERPNAYHYVVLMSDGVANVDVTNPFGILETAADTNSDNPLRLITIGVGIANYNDYLLEQLAQYGNGWYRYLNNSEQARTMFSRENWAEISTPFADQTRAQVMWDPEKVESWRLVGYENRIAPDEEFDQDRKKFAEIPSGAATTVFYEVELKDGAARMTGEVVELGTVKLRWVTPFTNESRQQGAAITGVTNVAFGESADDLLRFGSIVALASDSYGSLPYVEAEGASLIGSDLRALKDSLDSLRSGLSHLDSYNDFDYVLAYLVNTLPSYEGGSGGSGYSP